MQNPQHLDHTIKSDYNATSLDSPVVICEMILCEYKNVVSLTSPSGTEQAFCY